MAEVDLKNTGDKLRELEKFGNIPKNIGYDPYNAWVWHCGMCDSRGYIFEQGLSFKLRKAFRRGEMLRKRWQGCNRCKNGVTRVVKKMDRARAFHLNSIRFRS